MSLLNHYSIRPNVMYEDFDEIKNIINIRISRTHTHILGGNNKGRELDSNWRRLSNQQQVTYISFFYM